MLPKIFLIIIFNHPLGIFKEFSFFEIHPTKYVISFQPLNYAWFVCTIGICQRWIREVSSSPLKFAKMPDRNDFRQWWNEPFAILSSKLIRIQSKDLVMTCGPVFLYWYYNRYQAKGLGPNASTRLVWKFF